MRATAPGSRAFRLGAQHGTLTGSNVTLAHYIAFAYVLPAQISGAPAWVSEAPFDIVGFAALVSGRVDRKMVDETGIEGAYAVERDAFPVHAAAAEPDARLCRLRGVRLRPAFLATASTYTGISFAIWICNGRRRLRRRQ